MSSKEELTDYKQKVRIDVSGQTLTLTCITRVKVMICMKTCNDPTVITDILPQAVPRKISIENQFLTKALKVIFKKSGIQI